MTPLVVRQLSLHEDIQRISITIVPAADASPLYRVFAYEELGVNPAMTLSALRAAALAAVNAT